MDIILLILTLIIGLWAIILLINRHYDLKSSGVEVSPVAITWRTKRGLGFLDRIANSSKRLWKTFGITAAVVASTLMLLAFFNLANWMVLFGISIFAPLAASAGALEVVPFISGWTVSLRWIISFLIGIATVLLVHESAHGIMARRVGLPVRSTGLCLSAVIPGAFVELDGDKVKKAPVSDRLQVHGAGSFANILFCLLCFGLVLAFISPLPGLYISGVDENSPANNVDLQIGARLMEIGYQKDNLTVISDYQVFDNFMGNTEQDDNIILVTDSGDYIITLDNHPVENKGYIGIFSMEPASRSKLAAAQFVPILVSCETPGFRRADNPVLSLVSLMFGKRCGYNFIVPGLIIQLLIWMSVLNMGIGSSNLFPLKPLDGGRIAECLAERASLKGTARYVALALGVITLSTILISLLWLMWLG